MPKSTGLEAPAPKRQKRALVSAATKANKRNRKNVGAQEVITQTDRVQGPAEITGSAAEPLRSITHDENNIQGEINSIVSQIQRQSDWVAAASVDEISVEVMRARLDLLNRAWNRFEAKDRELQLESQQTDDFVGLQAVEDVYVKARAELITKIKATESSCSTAAGLPAYNGAMQNQFAELPLADRLPMFHGSHREWIHFRDIFTAEVIQNPHLTDLQRLRRLQSCVKDDAARALGYWPQRNDSFSDAWRTLCLAYDNEYLCHAAHCAAIYNLPCWSKATHAVIRNMLDVTRNSMRMVSRQLGAEEQRDLFILNFLESRLDSASRTQWEMARPTDRIPCLKNDFFTWLERRSSGLLSHVTYPVTYRENHINTPRNYPHIRANVSSSMNFKPCLSCGDNHALHRCPALGRLDREQKVKRILELGLCQNCLRKGHIARNCLSTRCPRCARTPHNSIICPKLPSNTKTEATQASMLTTSDEHQEAAKQLIPHREVGLGDFSTFHSVESAVQLNMSTAMQGAATDPHYNLLATAQVRLVTHGGMILRLRALCDTGAQINLINKDIVTHNQIHMHRTRVGVSSALGTEAHVCSKSISGELMSIYNDELRFPITCLVVPSILGGKLLPQRQIHMQKLPGDISNHLADPAFDQPEPVKILLGVGAWAELMMDNMRRISNGFVAQETRLGWLLFGEAPSDSHIVGTNATDANTTEVDYHLEELVRNFLTGEILAGDESNWTEEQQECENHFQQTYTYEPQEKRYVVQLPLRRDWERIGSNRVTALQRYLRLEQRFKREPELEKKYQDFINEYIAKDWLRLATRPPEGKPYYIPHHAIMNKFRVVFDASCSTDTGISLNDIQMVGPKLQRDLIDLLWEFRLYAFGISADIKQMFPQVKISSNHWDLQRIFWRDQAGKICEYWLTRVTFGMASAPFCAVRAMQQCAKDNSARWPRAAEVVLNNFYMDDCLAGADTEEELLPLCEQLQQLLAKGGFELSKWRSNSNPVQRALHSESEGNENWLKTPNEASVLGLKWIASTDELTFAVKSLPEVDSDSWSKRKVLSITARIYDPDGLASPFVINAKVLLQKIWQAKVGWDESLPEPLKITWQRIFDQIQQFSSVRVPRWIGFSRRLDMELHGFADASTQAFGAAIYAVIRDNGSVTSNLLLAKSRVTPLKKETIPRLELRAATLLGELMQRVMTICETHHNIQIRSAYCWSDSMVVLCWLKRDSAGLKQFVSNRVRKINKNTTTCKWKYVPTDANPADLISRGMSLSEMIASKIWWHGPEYLQLPEAMWPKAPDGLDEKVQTEVNHECRVKVRQEPIEADDLSMAHLSVLVIKDHSLLYRYSSFNRLIRVTAWVVRFTRNCRTSAELRKKLHLEVDELNDALAFWIKQEQRDHFGDDIRKVERFGQSQDSIEGLRLSNAIGELSPFLQDGILRMRSRLQEADLPDYQRNPAILPGKGRLAWLITQSTHLKLLHCGPQQLTSALRQNYWIIGIRMLARSLIKNCVVCARLKAKMCEQMMGNLPACRVRPARPFLHSGVDYAGPIQVRPDRRRGNVVIKGYVAVFVCMVSKAVHLEFVSDLSTNAFLMAFIRFTSRYGHCLHLWSDNGTNFVGAERELSRMLQTWRHSDLFEQLATRQTEWHFITPSAPHQGGLWEAAVKATKHHLRRVMGARLLTVEAIQTLLAEIGAVLNSRPLCAQSADPHDLNALTPGHLLIGEALVPVLGEQIPAERPENRLSYWQSRQLLTQRFWKLWSNSYLHELQQRPKWREARRNMKIGDLVVIKNEATPPTLWKMGRVTALHPGSDGLVRNVTLWTGQNTISRPVQKLCLLPVESVEPRLASSLKAGGCSSEIVAIE